MNKTGMDKTLEFLERLIRVFAWFGVAFMMILMMVTIVNIVLRFFNYGINGAYEIGQNCLVAIVWFGVATAVLRDDMIELDIIKFPRIYMLILRLFSAAMCAVIGVCTVIQGNVARLLGSASNILKIPRHPFQWITAFGFFLIVPALIVVICKDRRDREASGKEKYAPRLSSDEAGHAP